LGACDDGVYEDVGCGSLIDESDGGIAASLSSVGWMVVVVVAVADRGGVLLFIVVVVVFLAVGGDTIVSFCSEMGAGNEGAEASTTATTDGSGKITVVSNLFSSGTVMVVVVIVAVGVAMVVPLEVTLPEVAGVGTGDPVPVGEGSWVIIGGGRRREVVTSSP